MMPTQSITVTRHDSAIVAPLSLAFDDPTVVGATNPALSGTTASFTLVAVARGTAVVTGTDGSGATGSLGVTSGTCGRPEAMSNTPVLLSPKSGSTGVSPSIGTLYFGVYTVYAPPQINLHLIVGAHGTLEAGTLARVSTLPAGTATAPPPQSGQMLTYFSASVPPLNGGTSYRTQLYDDACQPAQIAGGFST